MPIGIHETVRSVDVTLNIVNPTPSIAFTTSVSACSKILPIMLKAPITSRMGDRCLVKAGMQEKLLLENERWWRVEHINDWNSTGRMHQAEAHCVPILDNMPPIPYSTPTNDVMPNPVIHGEPLHVKPTHVEPFHIDEEINGNIHANGSISAVIPNDVAADPLPRLLSIEQFREEMLQEMMHEELIRNGVIQHQICAHEHHRSQLDEVVLNDGRTSSRHYLVVEHMTRHD
jgi:hypothetical protein